MRSLYWLTAITLVAAAVTTVAIADYGRRHPQAVEGRWTATALRLTASQDQEKTSSWVTEKLSDRKSDDAMMPILPPLADVPQNSTVETPKPIRVEDVPEHQQLREAALNNLASTNLDVPALPTPSVKTPVATPVVDEFTFTEKPLAPLYVPVQPNAQVVMPPASVVKEVSKLPNIPGVSLTQSNQKPMPLNSTGFSTLPSYRPEPARGAEVMPGLHAAVTEPSDFDNPVADSMMALGELVSAMNPATYLLSMPIDKKAVKPSMKFAAEIKDLPLVTPTVACNDLKTCPACPACSTKPACSEACTSDEIVVRTYSIADFATVSGTSHDDLIRLISTMVAPDSWKTRDSNIEFFPQGKCLVVRHRASVQQQVDDLLSQLRGQVQKTARGGVYPQPAVRREPTITMPVELELVPVAPREKADRIPRVITNEPAHPVGDDEFFGMIPMRLDGRLMPVPMPLESSSLVPAQFQPRTSDPVWMEEGPARLNIKPRTPEFFPWFLPYAPLPSGPDSCEEQVHRVGQMNYTEDEIAYFFLLACEWEENR